MINKIESGNVNSIKKTPRYYSLNNQSSKSNTAFTGLFSSIGNAVLYSVQKCEQNPMLNVTCLDMTTAIVPRTFSETVIGSKQKDKAGNDTKKRKYNFIGGFEAFRREFSGLFINCLIPSFIVIGAAKLLNRPIMGNFKKSNLTTSWANSDTIDKIQKYYTQANATEPKAKIMETLKTMINDIEGVNGDVAKDGLKKFSEIFANDKELDSLIEETAEKLTQDNKKSSFKRLYNYLVKKSGIAENIKFKDDKGYFSSSLEHLCSSTEEILQGIQKESKNLNSPNELNHYFSKAKKLVNGKSILGLGLIIPLAILAQPINRWITHKISGKKGAPIYNDDEERILTPAEKRKLLAEKFIAVPAMAGVAALSMLLDKPSLKMFQFKGLFPTMDQARIISATTFSSRIASAEDSNELTENTIRDIATFSSFYFLGDYAAKGIATIIEKYNKFGIKLLNKLQLLDKNTNIAQKIWHWAKHTKMKSSDELSSITDRSLRIKAKNLRALCQVGNFMFSLLSLGLFIPLYTRTQTNKKKNKQELESSPNLTFASLTPDKAPSFKAFLEK